MKLIKKVFPFLLIPFIVWGVERFCHQKTGGFSLGRVISHLPYNPQWETRPISSEEETEIKKILSQPFTYLNRGAQAFVFISQDGKYVLKLFQHYRMRPPFWAPLAPEISKKKVERRESLLRHDFLSYKIAFDNLKRETGLIYTHLNKTDFLKQKTTIIDKIGIHHEIDLDKMEFLVQRKADLLFPQLKNANFQAGKKMIDALVNFMIVRSEKGIFDKDPDFSTNFGVCEGEVMQIDVGRFEWDKSRKDPAIYNVDIIHAADPFIKWLKTENPPLAEYLDEKVHSY